MDELHSIIDGNLVHTEPPIQKAAGASLRDFLASFGSAQHEQHIKQYCEHLFDKDSPSVRAGGGLALAALPRHVLLPVWPHVLTQLAKASTADTAAVRGDADARVKAIEVRCALCLPTAQPARCVAVTCAVLQAMVTLVAVVYDVAASGVQGAAGAEPSVRAAVLSEVVPALLRALQDYTTDNRGDVGSMCAPLCRTPCLSVLALLTATPMPRARLLTRSLCSQCARKQHGGHRGNVQVTHAASDAFGR